MHVVFKPNSDSAVMLHVHSELQTGCEFVYAGKHCLRLVKYRALIISFKET